MKIITTLTILILGFYLPSHADVDHSEFIEADCLTGEDVTRNCLECHEEAAEDFMETAHWRWKGETPYLINHETDHQLGKINLMNDY